MPLTTKKNKRSLLQTKVSTLALFTFLLSPLPLQAENHTPQPTNLTLEKNCTPRLFGSPLTCQISLHNQGPTPINGIIRLMIKANAPASNSAPSLKLLQVTPDKQNALSWHCDTSLSPYLLCTIKGTHLPPKKHAKLTVKYQILSAKQNSVHICTSAHQDIKTTKEAGQSKIKRLARHCITDKISVTLTKTGPKTCTKGKICPFKFTLANTSQHNFEGPIKLADALGLAGQGQTGAITKITPPLPCTTQPKTIPFVCKGKLSLKAGKSQTHTLLVRFPSQLKLKSTARLRNCGLLVDQNLQLHGQAKAPIANQNERHPGCHSFHLTTPLPPKTPPSCPKGQTGTPPNCKKIKCPKGTKGTPPNCKKIKCLKGYTGTPPNCRKIKCPSGYTGTPSNCKKIKCPKGTTGTPPNCRKIKCPKGFTGTPPLCKKIKCPKGYTGKPPYCRKLKCPSGFTGTPPHCRKLKCPRGYTGAPPYCRKLPTPCPKGTKRIGTKCVRPAM